MSATVAPPPVEGPSGLPAVEVLDDVDRWSLQRLLERHPYAACVLAARIAAAGSLHPARLGGEVLGVRDPRTRQILACCFVGGSVVPVGGDVRALAALGRAVGSRQRRATELVGEADTLAALWAQVAPAWGPPRADRWRQPLLVLDRAPRVRPDPGVRAAVPADLDTYVPAAAAMFAGELGVSPYATGGEAAYRARVAAVVAAGRAFVRTDRRGRVLFKAEIGAVSADTAQIQGVWVDPEFRGQGLGAAGVAAVVVEGLRIAPAVSLYVNDYNHAARRVYARLGFAEVGTLATILY
ncbi:GNAT family N-acetyltransferase [Jatrophihabitans sp. YIM 134969]